MDEEEDEEAEEEEEDEKEDLFKFVTQRVATKHRLPAADNESQCRPLSGTRGDNTNGYVHKLSTLSVTLPK